MQEDGKILKGHDGTFVEIDVYSGKQTGMSQQTQYKGKFNGKENVIVRVTLKLRLNPEDNDLAYEFQTRLHHETRFLKDNGHRNVAGCRAVFFDETRIFLVFENFSD